MSDRSDESAGHAVDSGAIGQLEGHLEITLLSLDTDAAAGAMKSASGTEKYEAQERYKKAMRRLHLYMELHSALPASA